MIGRTVWLLALTGLAVMTALLQLDRQAETIPALATLVPEPLRAYSQPLIAARAAERDDPAAALIETQRLIRRRPVPAEHLTLLAVAQTKAGLADQAGLSIQIAGQRGWREPLAQEAVLRLALAAEDKPEAARRYTALFLRAATPDTLLSELGPSVLNASNGDGQRTLVDIISGTNRWNDVFLRRGAKVMPPSAFVDIATQSLARGVRFDCGALAQTVKGLTRSDAQAAERLSNAAKGRCPQLSP